LVPGYLSKSGTIHGNVGENHQAKVIGFRV
jgi:hypothetical protein